MLDHKEMKEKEETRDSQENRDLLDPKACQDLLDQRGRGEGMVETENVDLSGLLVKRESQATQVHQECPDPKDTEATVVLQVPKDHQAMKANGATQGSPGLRDHKEKWD